MLKIKDRLPPANSLIVFEAVARHESFTKAAQELSVSQAAVSRQIQIAEEALRIKLFERHHRRIRLTAHGQTLYNSVTMGLGHMARTCDELRAEIDHADILISSSVSFASYWLMSRIAKFRAQFPDYDVRLVAAAKVRDMAAIGVDFVVRYGKGGWPNAEADHMFGNEIFPVCSQEYLERHGPFEDVDDLERATLLKLSQADNNWTRWKDWFDAFNAEYPVNANVLRFDSYMLLIHAAIRGEGIALCGRRFAEDLIKDKELVRPINVSLKSENAFYLLRPSGRTMSAKKAQFREWLLAEATDTSAGEDG